MDTDVDLLLQKQDFDEDDGVIGGKPCVQRREETARLLQVYQAARLVKLDSPEYGVEDDTTTQLVHAWEQQYKEAQAEYDFYCTQTEDDLAEIADAVQKKEAVAVQNAAQAGLIAAQATIKHKRIMAEKAHAAAAERQAKLEADANQRKKSAREKTDKIADETIQKNTERLKRLPQISRSLYVKVLDGSTGKPLSGAKVVSTCLFTNREVESRSDGLFTIGNGVSGPSGRQCKVTTSKPGYATSQFPVTVMQGDTDGVFVHPTVLPETSDPKKFRFVLQYGGSRVPTEHAHVLIPMPDATYVDIGKSPLFPDDQKLKFGSNGTSEELPFATLDHTEPRFGPETASVHNVNDGVYYFLAHNQAHAFTTAEDFQHSEARAYLYQGNKLLNTVAIESATGEPSDIWSIYTLSCMRGVCSFNIANEFAQGRDLGMQELE